MAFLGKVSPGTAIHPTHKFIQIVNQPNDKRKQKKQFHPTSPVYLAWWEVYESRLGFVPYTVIKNCSTSINLFGHTGSFNWALDDFYVKRLPHSIIIYARSLCSTRVYKRNAVSKFVVSYRIPDFMFSEVWWRGELYAVIKVSVVCDVILIMLNIATIAADMADSMCIIKQYSF